MSMRPSFFRGLWDDPWEGMRQPSRLYDQHFGHILPDDLCPATAAAAVLPFPFTSRPMFTPPPVSLTRVQPPQQTGISEFIIWTDNDLEDSTEQQNEQVLNSEKEFRVSMDVQHFKPEEISIKTKNNRVIITACHEERPDEHGFIMRQFTRQYVLPNDVDPASVSSSLSRDGILILKAPKIVLEPPKEHIIPITQEAEDK